MMYHGFGNIKGCLFDGLMCIQMVVGYLDIFVLEEFDFRSTRMYQNLTCTVVLITAYPTLGLTICI